MNRYQILNACGEGFYGTVFKSRHKQSDTLVAIKQFKGKEDYATKREIETLSKLKHPNIINLREVFREQGKLHMVFEFLDTDLLNALGKYPKGMPERLVRIYMSQLCKALDYCHQRGVVHRDLKPENLLVTGDVQNPDPKRSLKLCDFGEARDIAPGDKFLSGIIGTRWYRAPEILVGAKVAAVSKSNDASSFNKVTRPKLLRYDFQVDMWGAGCIMGELLLASPMFPADTDLQQLEMVQVYGTPQQLTRRFKGKCSGICEAGLKGLLDLSPHKRLTAKSALQHQFFGRRGSGGGGGKNSFADAHSAAHSRAKFKQNASSRGMGGLDEIDEEIDTESDSDFGEEVVGMPEDDHSYDDYGDDEHGDLEQPEQPEQPHVNDIDDDDVGYSDDEFEEGYSDDEFDEPVEEVGAEEKVPEAAEQAKRPEQQPSSKHSKSRTKQASAPPQAASSTKQSGRKVDVKKATAAKTGTKSKPSSGKSTASKPPRGQSVAKSSSSVAGGGAVAGSTARAKLDSRASVRSKPGSRASVRSKPGSRASVRSIGSRASARSTNSKTSTRRGSGRGSSRGSQRGKKVQSAASNSKSKSKKAVPSSKTGSGTKTAKHPDAGAAGSKKKKAATEKVPASSRNNNASANGDRAASKKRQKASSLKTKKAGATDPVRSKKKSKKKAKVL